MKLNLTEASDFLSFFNYELITIQYLKNKRAAGYTTLDAPDDLTELVEAHKGRREVFFMVNEGDGKVYRGRKTPRSQKNVKTLKSLFIDTDTCPLDVVTAFLDSHDLRPHYIVESSPNKYHLYLKLEDTAVTKDSLDRWRYCQTELATLGGDENYTCDTSMSDHAKVLRVPGFFHLKGKPFLTRVFEADLSVPAYSLKEISEALGYGDSREVMVRQTYEPPETVAEGQRHHELTRFIGSIMSKGISPEIAEISVKGFIIDKFKNPEEFLSGNRYEEVKRIIEWKAEEIRKEEEKRVTKEALAILDNEDDANLDPFSLNDDFYFSAPGLVGEITKSICDTARYPIPSFSFGAAISALGTLRARTTTSELGHAPSNFFLCLAATGSGKNYAQEVLSHTFQAIGITSLMQSGVRSEKGLARFLESNSGVGFLSMDEAEGFFSTLSDRYTPHYLRACKPLLLELYTSTNTPYKHLGQTGNQKSKAESIVLRYPRLNILAYGVVHALQEAFNSKSIADGLLQRFIVLTSYRERVANENFSPAAPLPPSILSKLKDHATASNYALEEQLLEMDDLAQEIENTASEAKRERLKAKLEKLEGKSTANRNILRFTPKARQKYEKFAKHLDSLANKELKKLSGLEGLYTRGAEQVGRLAVAMATTQIDSETIEYLTTFIESRIQAVTHLVKESFHDTQHSKDVKYLKTFVAQQMRRNGGKAVSKRDILRKSKLRDVWQLNKILDTALAAEEIREVDVKTPGPKGVFFTL